VLVGLPLLEGLRSRQAEAAPPPEFRFAIFMREGNGVAQKQGTEIERFWPTNLGALTKASLAADTDRAVSELADYADKLLLVRGCKYNFSTSGCGHADGGLQCLTAAKPDGPNSNKALAMGESNRQPHRARAGARRQRAPHALCRPKSGYLDEVLSYRGAKDRRTAEGNPPTLTGDSSGCPTPIRTRSPSSLSSERASTIWCAQRCRL
jgi:hypothetical protein